MSIIAWALANWRLVAAGALIVGVLGALWFIDDRAYDRGYAARDAEYAQAEKERTDAANAADDAARRCAADPECSVRNDGWRRD